MSDPTSPTNSPNVLGYSSPPVSSTASVVWCRLLAICMLGWGAQSLVVGLVEAIELWPRAWSGASTLMLFAYFLDIGLPAAIWLLLAWYCWAKAPSLADRMTRDRVDNLSPQGISANELLTTLIIGIGIYLLAEGLPAVAQLILFTQPRNGTGFGSNFNALLVGAIVRCSIGLWLILGTRGILNLIRRHGGKRRDSNEPTP